MSYNGNGVFNINTAGQPVVPGTVISSTAFNALTADLANGLTTAITKDGQTTPTANIPLGGFRITGLGAAVATTDAVQYGQLQSNSFNNLIVSGVDVLTATANPALTAYTAGNAFYFVVGSTNTGAMTINIDSLGAKDIRRAGSTALAAGDLVAGQTALIVYNGTNFQLLNGNAFTNLRVSGTLTGNAVNCSSTTITSSAPTLSLIDTDGADFSVHVNSNTWYVLNQGGAGVIYTDQSGNFTAAGNVTAFSDERLKSDIKTIPAALDTVDQLRGVSFVKDGKANIGVIAQEVQKVLPQVVQENADGYLSVAYGNLVGVLIEAVKELRAEVKALKGE